MNELTQVILKPKTIYTVSLYDYPIYGRLESVYDHQEDAEKYCEKRMPSLGSGALKIEEVILWQRAAD